MKDFPLAPFLASLEAERIRVTLSDYSRIAMVLRAGGTWTLARLRGSLLALLAKSENEESIIRQKFDSFFDLKLATNSEIKEEELQQALAEINQLLTAPESEEDLEVPFGLAPLATKRKVRQPIPLSHKPTLRQRALETLRAHLPSVIAATLALGLLTALWTTYPNWRRWFVQADNPTISVQRDSSEVATTSYEPFTLSARAVAFTQLRSAGNWKDYAGVALLAGWLLWSLFVLYQLLTAPAPEERLPVFAPDAPSHFARGEIGGLPEPQLDDATLTNLADSLGFFRSELPGKMLDADASVKAVVENGGMPVLVFHKRKHLRTVLIMEDAFAEPLAWNTVAGELVEGLSRRGVPVLHGKFDGVPSAFHAEGHTLWLDDLDNNRRDYLLLIFSDGKGISQHNTLTLEALSRWPMVAWMELREPPFWDESTVRVARHGIPVYPATADGLTQVMSRFLTEQGAEKQSQNGSTGWRGAPAFAGGALAPYVEKLLGDSLLWAQACAMIQPVTLGLADALRRHFQPHLPPERVGRLMYLPGTTQSVLGIKFSTPVLSVLRAGFAARWEVSKQEEILTFILEKLKEVKPERTDSLAHLAWEATFERVRLELEPEAASRRLARLDGTPLHHFIRAELENVKLPGDDREHESESSPLVPLRVAPQDDRALQQLAHIADKVKPPPVLSRLRTFVKRARQRLDNFTNFANSLFSSALKPFALYNTPSYYLFRALLRQAQRDQDKSAALLMFSYIDDVISDFPFGVLIYFYYPLIYPFVRRRLRAGRSQPPLLVVGPNDLDFGVGGQGKSYVQRLIVTNAGGGSITGKVSADRDWLTILPTGFALAERAVGLRIEASTEGMLSGIHTGTITLDTSEGQKYVRVRLMVFAFNWRDFLPWKNLDRRTALRWLAFSLPLVVIAAATVPRFLPPNWINRWYNPPPVLEKITPVSDGTEVTLTAEVTDPHGDLLTYRWQSDAPSIEGTSEPNSTVLNFSGVDPSLIPSVVNVSLAIDDARGGNSVYAITVPLEMATTARDPEKTIGPDVNPVKPTESETKGGNPTSTTDATEAATAKITLINSPRVPVEVRDNNGKTYLKTDAPLTELPLKPGLYLLWIVYSSEQFQAGGVTLAQGESVRVDVNSYLMNKLGRLIVRGLDENTTILIDGRQPSVNAAGGSVSMFLPIGRHKITYLVNGFVERSQTIDLPPGTVYETIKMSRAMTVDILVDQKGVDVEISSPKSTHTLSLKIEDGSSSVILPPGSYYISAKKAGYETLRTTFTVTQPSNELSISMKPATGSTAQDESFRPAQLIGGNVISYPPSLVGVALAGIMEVNVTVGVDMRGKVTSVNLEGTDPKLISALSEAVSKLKFKPATRGGKPVADTQTLKIVFEKKSPSAR